MKYKEEVENNNSNQDGDVQNDHFKNEIKLD
jgi:hypothetical protein